MSPVRGTRVLDGVSSARPVCIDTCDRVRVLLRAIRIAQRRLYASTTGNRASSNARLRRVARERERRRDVAVRHHIGPGDAPKAVSPSLGGRAEHLFFFRIVFAKRKNLCMFSCNAQFSMRRGQQRAAPNGLPDAGPGGAPNGASPGLGGRAEPLFFFRIVFAKRKYLCMFVSNAQFSMHPGWQSAAPNALPDAGPGDAPNGASPGLAAGKYVKFLCRVVLPN